MAGNPLAVRGLADVQRGFAKAEDDIRLGFRRGMRAIAEPIRSDIEVLARQNIPSIGKDWYRMRTGVTRNLLYVAPRQRGVKGKPDVPRRRGPQFTNLMLDRAMEPALARHEGQVVGDFEDLLDFAADNFNRGGVPV